MLFSGLLGGGIEGMNVGATEEWGSEGSRIKGSRDGAN